MRLRHRRSALSLLPDDITTEVLFGGQLIVGAAAQREIVDARWAQRAEF